MAGTSGAIRAGRAFVQLFVDDNQLTRGLADASRRLKSWGAGVAKLGAGIGAGGAAVGAPLFAMLRQATDRGAQVDALGKRLNASAEDVSALQFAFERAGVGIEEFGGVMTALQQRFSNAADSGDDMLRRLRLNDRGMMFLPWKEQINALADAMKNVADPADQARVAQDLFGDAGLRMLDVLKKGSAGLREQTDAARAFGAVISGDQARQATVITRAWTDVQLALKTALMEVGMILVGNAGGVTELKDRIIGGINVVREWIKENRGWVIAAAAVAGSVVGIGAAVVGLGSVVSAAGAVMGVVLTAVKLSWLALTGIVGATLSPLGLVAAAVVGIGVAIATQTTAGEGFFGRLKGGALDFAATAKDAWGGINEAVKRGDFAQAGQVAWAALKKTWADVCLWMTEQWEAIKAPFVNTWDSITGSIKQGIADLKSAFGDFFSGVKGFFTDFYDATLQPWVDLFGKLTAEVNTAAAAHQAAHQAAVDAAGKSRTVGSSGYKVVHFEVDTTGMTGLREQQRQAQIQTAKDAAHAAAMAFKQALREPFMNIAGGGWKTSGDDFEKDLAHLEEERRARAAAQAEQLKKSIPADSVKGTFALSSGAQQFGYGDNVAKRSLDELGKIAVNAVALPRIEKAVADVAKGLRFH